MISFDMVFKGNIFYLVSRNDLGVGQWGLEIPYSLWIYKSVGNIG